MPTVSRIGGLNVRIYTNDHRPAHVHVMGPNGEAVFELNCPDGPPILREIHGKVTRAEATKIVAALAKMLSELCEKWSEIHG